MKRFFRILSALICTLTVITSLPLFAVAELFAADTAPVVYLSMSNGNNANKGTKASPVKTIERAFDVLNETYKGGTIVLMDGVNTRTNTGSGAKLLTLKDAGGDVTITANYGGINYQSEYNARLMLYDGLAFKNNVTFDYITFLRVNATANRGLYMCYNDLTVTENCTTYTYNDQESYAVGNCPGAKTKVSAAGYQVIVTGYSYNPTTTTSSAIQTIDIRGGAFDRILVGNKTFVKDAATAPTDKGGTDNGTVFIKISENALLTNYIDATQSTTDFTTYVNLSDKNTEVRFNDGVNASDFVTVSSDEYFTDYGYSLKDYESDEAKGPAVGISYDVDVSFVDSTPVSEFGVAFKLDDGAPFATIDGTERSYAYTSGEGGYRNYKYKLGDLTASFKGVLVYDDGNELLELDTKITAYPYAIDETTGYMLVGNEKTFSLMEICDLIISNTNAPVADRVLAEDILLRANSFTIERFAADPIPEAPESSVVYVSKAGGGDGLTPDSTVTFEQALGMTKNVVADTVVIVVTDAITLDPADTINPDKNDTNAVSANFTYFLPANKSKVIITSNYGGVNYKQQNGASITLTSEVAFYGDYTIKNTELINATDLKICLQYNDVTLGTGLTCTMGAGASKYIDVVCGYHAGHSAFNTSEKVSCREDAKIEILDGTWNGFTAGNVTQNWRSVFGNIYEDATLIVEIGNDTKAPTFKSTDRNYFAVAGQNNVDGTVCVNVNNATFESANPLILSQYLMKYDTMMADYHPVINGNVILNIKGGTFNNNRITAVPTADSSNYVSNVGTNAKLSINVLGGTFSSSYLHVTGCGSLNSEVYFASAYHGSTSTITKASQATAEPTLDYEKTTYDAPPVYDKTVVEGIFDVSKASDAELDELSDSLPPHEVSATHLSTVIDYYNNKNLNKNLDDTSRADMRKLNDKNYNLTQIAGVEFITMLSGEYSINKTFTNYNIGASGGGYMVDCGDFVLVAFGDTEGEAKTSAEKNDPTYGGPWRANVLAFTDDDDYKDGILLDGFYLSDQGVYDGIATEFLKSGHTNGVEMSKIPTGAVMIGDNIYFCYMSVRRWSDDDKDNVEDNEGIWKCNYGGLAISRDMGRTWETPSDLRWSEESEFAQLYPVLDNEGKWLYIFGVPGGRRGAVKLMRVPADDVENIAAYEYFVGYDARGKAVFEQGEAGLANSKPIIDTPEGNDHAGAGGLAIMYNEFLGEWIMLYASSETGNHTEAGIYMRVANSIDGVWSEPVLVISQSAGYGAVYEPRICAKYQDAETGEMMLITSNWGIYNSMVFNVKLERRGTPIIETVH